MASLLSILKNVIDLNSVHVEKQDIVTVQVARFGELHDEKQIHLYLRPDTRTAVQYVDRSVLDMTTGAIRKAGGEQPI